MDIQTISVVELSDSKVWGFWGRAVNNRDLQIGHANKYFRGTTLGELTRVSSECPALTADPPVPSAP
ncbi:MAG: hypothetical protein HY856_10685 [Burkholderiales bacterium]|nr:hypothetical protein [Burkholderiales bacterium]